MTESCSAAARAYMDRTPKSKSLHERAERNFPNGVTHDTRHLAPYPVFVSHADGSRKWDVDGNEYVDYFGGHGALLLGHNHPAIVDAVREQLSRGTHFGASHEIEVEWADLIKQLIPCAEKVRFTGSGTEACLLGLRVTRAFTGKAKVLRFSSHFHGWHDQVAFDAASGDGGPPAGITAETVKGSVLCPANDIDRVGEILAAADDIGAVLIEPTGASFGRVPTSGEFLVQLRELTRQHDVLLIFDEVITGFRCSPGGAQAHYGVTPDLTFLAKIVAGGFPGGALVGRADVMDVISFSDDADWNRTGRVPHKGTFNANPISAAAGRAALQVVATSDVTDRANANGAHLRDALNAVIHEEGLNWVVYGEFSGFHILPLDDTHQVSLSDIYSGGVDPGLLKGATSVSAIHDIRCGLLAGGVDILPWPGGIVSAIHSPVDIDATADGFRSLLTHVKQPGRTHG